VDADLVTLSACETGLGKVFQGEGLVGLTRAFQFAGARTVLASLWPVSDEGTAELMRSFYTNLKGGATKNEALRAAQLHLLRGNPPQKKGGKDAARIAGAHSSPFHWAAFQLVGDWK
jgi:CHAT domain-containing protein